MNLINTTFPQTRITERNGRYIYVSDATGATAQIPTTATPAELAAVGLYERTDTPPEYDPATQRLVATGQWVAGARQYEVISLTLEEARQRKLAALEEHRQSLRDAGVTIDLGGGTAVNLEVSDARETEWTQALSVINGLIAEHGQATADALLASSVFGPVMDRHGVELNPALTIAQMRALALAYAASLGGLRAVITGIKQAIEAAATVEDLLAINW